MGRRKVLLVDDEKAFTSTLKLALESSGNFFVRVENDACKAVETAAQYRPDLILLDVIMPEKEGPDIAFELRHHHDLKETPIIFLTATVTREEVNTQHGEIGGHTFVAKPSPLKDLIDTMERNMVAI